MQNDNSRWEHDHVFDRGNTAGERGTRAVAWLTAVMMVAEIVGGTLFGSMAGVSDGWPIRTHSGAVGLAAGRPAFPGGGGRVKLIGALQIDAKLSNNSMQLRSLRFAEPQHLVP